jgi:hypothetical protein
MPAAGSKLFRCPHDLDASKPREKRNVTCGEPLTDVGPELRQRGPQRSTVVRPSDDR